MEPTNNSQQNSVGRPSIDGMAGRSAPMRRPIVNDFVARRPAYGTPAPQSTPRPTTPTSSALQPPTPSAPPLPPQANSAVAQPTAPSLARQPAGVFRTPNTSPTTAPTLHASKTQLPTAPATKLTTPFSQPAPITPIATPHQPAPTQDRPHAKPFTQPKHKPSRSGLVGFITFILLSTGAFAPIISNGIILQNTPGSSQSVTSGTDTIGCAKTLISPATTSTYTSKVGFPIVYTYTQTTTFSATCEGKRSSVISSRNSQFNPLGALINLAAVVILATAVAKIWKLVRER